MKKNIIKIEIKSRYTESVIYEYECENNTMQITLKKAVSEKINLYGANLKGANLKGAYLKGAYLDGANLKGANLDGANLEGAYLKGANLDGANLEGANLKGAYLYGANLEDANLEGANLEGANLEGAYLEGAYLTYYDNDTDVDKETIIEEFEEKTSFKITTFENRHILAPYYHTYWRYGLVIDTYEYIEQEQTEEIKETSVSEEQVLFNKLSSENKEFIIKQMRLLQPVEEVYVNE